MLCRDAKRLRCRGQCGCYEQDGRDECVRELRVRGRFGDLNQAPNTGFAQMGGYHLAKKPQLPVPYLGSVCSQPEFQSGSLRDAATEVRGETKPEFEACMLTNQQTLLGH